MENNYNHLKSLFKYLVTQIPLNNSNRAEFLLFWDEYLSLKYKYTDEHKFFQQVFLFKCSIHGGNVQMNINVSGCLDNLEVLPIITRQFTCEDFIYNQTRKNFLSAVNKLIHTRYIGQYPIMAIKMPNSADKKYIVVEGNHRISTAVFENRPIDVLCFETFLLPPNMFLSIRNWLSYIMIASFYQILNFDSPSVCFQDIGTFLDQYTA